MRSLVISSNIVSTKSPAAPLEQGLVNDLVDRGVNTTVITSNEDRRDVKAKFKIIYTPFSRFIVFVLLVIGKVFSDLVWLPDATYYAWGIGAKHKARKLLKQDSYNYLHSFGFANACHWVCYKVKKSSNIPWVATFFDSWTDYPSRKFHTKFFRRIDQKMERKVAIYSDLIIHDNENIANLWRERYGVDVARKIIVIPLPFNPSNESRSPLVVHNKEVLTISHLGTFYEYRDATAFIEAVRLFCVKHSDMKSRLKINFVGITLKRDIELISRYALSEVFNIVGRVSAEACQTYYREADILLTTTGCFGEDVMFPSKIIKYFYYDRPILGLAGVGSITKYELEKAGHRTFSPNETDQISDYILGAFKNYGKICNYNHDYWKKFDSTAVSNAYFNEIYKVLSNNTK